MFLKTFLTQGLVRPCPGAIRMCMAIIFKHFLLLPNLLYAELLSNFDCLTNFPSLPARSGFDELFPVTTFLTVVQSHDMLISMFLYIT